MDKQEIIKNIAYRTGGDIYLGVVGAVRTGKSTFIKKVVESLVVPNIEDEYERKRTLDEIPQSSGGKTIMTIEPKFVPNNVAKIKIDDMVCNMRLVDCVGYVIDNAKGYEDENGPRMVKTPWYPDEIPFIEAAEIGTEKVIKDHSTIGIIITTDGSIGEFSRNDYVSAEEKVVKELESIHKPYIMVLNTTKPTDSSTLLLVRELKDKYKVPVLPIDVLNMNEVEITNILREALYEFPVLEVNVNIPEWIGVLKPNHYVKKAYIDKIKESVVEVDKLRDVDGIVNHFSDSSYISKAYMSEVDPKTGIITINLEAPNDLFEDVLNEMIDIDISNKANLLSMFQEYKESREEYEQFKTALKMVKTTGYGVANPTIKDMKLDKPEITKQGSRYGIKLKAKAPSIHMIRVDVESSFEPIIGTESQSKELIDHLMKDSKDDPNSIWSSEIFGRSLDTIVQEGIQSKIAMMPENVRYKFQQTMSKVVNKGSNNLIAIVI
ncbi:MAG: stage IV sporulation protein A [Bacilli bacterium]|nr:stage IV sporulation protein A [Bacilli bacterium]